MTETRRSNSLISLWIRTHLMLWTVDIRSLKSWHFKVHLWVLILLHGVWNYFRLLKFLFFFMAVNVAMILGHRLTKHPLIIGRLLHWCLNRLRKGDVLAIKGFLNLNLLHLLRWLRLRLVYLNISAHNVPVSIDIYWWVDIDHAIIALVFWIVAYRRHELVRNFIDISLWVSLAKLHFTIL
jgi:hypothetical protein